jgi:hypothetical protein
MPDFPGEHLPPFAMPNDPSRAFVRFLGHGCANETTLLSAAVFDVEPKEYTPYGLHKRLGELADGHASWMPHAVTLEVSTVPQLERAGAVRTAAGNRYVSKLEHLGWRLEAELALMRWSLDYRDVSLQTLFGVPRGRTASYLPIEIRYPICRRLLQDMEMGEPTLYNHLGAEIATPHLPINVVWHHVSKLVGRQVVHTLAISNEVEERAIVLEPAHVEAVRALVGIIERLRPIRRPTFDRLSRVRRQVAAMLQDPDVSAGLLNKAAAHSANVQSARAGVGVVESTTLDIIREHGTAMGIQELIEAFRDRGHTLGRSALYVHLESLLNSGHVKRIEGRAATPGNVRGSRYLYELSEEDER